MEKKNTLQALDVEDPIKGRADDKPSSDKKNKNKPVKKGKGKDKIKFCAVFSKYWLSIFRRSNGNQGENDDSQLKWALQTRSWGAFSVFTILRLMQCISQQGAWFGPTVDCTPEQYFNCTGPYNQELSELI